MKTRYLTVNANYPEPKLIAQGAEVVINGGLVAFPTETVYGLGADGLNPDAVLKIFQVKGRPQGNPLILHVSSLYQARELASFWPPAAELLADRFLPGPLTLILPRSRMVPEQVTAGLPTVALRYPSNRVALALIEASGVPIAAPSANISGRPSPTCTQHVLTDMDGKIDMILDGGPVQVGVESTILSLAETPPTLLRPGGVTREEIEQVLGEEIVVPEYVLHPEERSSEGSVPSPGIYFKHYSPQADVLMVTGSPDEQVAKVENFMTRNKDRRVAVLATSEHYPIYQNSSMQPVYLASLGSRLNPDEIANHLFGAFRECDEAGAEIILVDTISPTGMGLAVMNRLCRAAEQHCI
ncbi:MAG TPA: threonylcarbamoyl-AMP synthase [Peptococcaceae bacterium]|nr:threonylcarbamoyl-AMP synthase [Peptococcaceae bacterium]